MVQKTRTGSDMEWFTHHLRMALTCLYDPSVLRESPLLVLLGVDQRRDAVSALRRSLTEAVESLRPNENTPSGSRTWRVYHILRRRYVEQLTQRKVASDLGLSVRQLQREEKLARQVLADHLWAVHDLAARVSGDDAQDAPADARAPSRMQELEYLRNSVTIQQTQAEDVIEEVLATIGPLLEAAHVSAAYTAHESLPHMFVYAPLFRQALLNIVNTAVHCAKDGHLHIQVQALPPQIYIDVRATTHQAAPPQRRPERAESLKMAEQLIHLCQGSLELVFSSLVEGEAFSARIALPIAEQATVLVIDDNADTLQLLQRYLSGSHYRYVGAQDAQQGFALAEELIPQVIVLDVMMPQQDGWTLLGRLREHPKTRDIPVVVCTILSEEELAMALGAAEFIRKPVARAELLSALDRQLGPPARAPC